MKQAGNVDARSRFERYVHNRKRNIFDTLPVRIDKTVKTGVVSVRRKCNFGCYFCHDDNFLKRDEIPAIENDFFVATLMKLHELVDKPLRVHIAGNGEPTLTGEELLDLISKTKALNFVQKVSMTSNGLLIGKLAQQLADAGLDSLNVSVHSLERARYVEITRIDALDLVLENIRKALEIGLSVKINSAATSGMITEIRKYIDLACTLGITIKIFPLIDRPKEEMEDLMAMLDLLQKLACDKDDYLFPHKGRIFLIGNGIIDFIDDASYNGCPNIKCNERASCTEGCRYNIRLTIDGKMQPCPVRSDNIVNLLFGPSDTEILKSLRSGGKV